MKILKRLASAIFLLWCLLIFSVGMLAILPFIVIITALVKGKAGHDAAFFFIRVWGWLVSIFGLFPVRTVNRSVCGVDKAHIFVSNHNSYLDSVAAVVAIPQPFKPLGKVEMDRIPVFGIIYRRLVVMIDRNSQKNRKQCEADLRNQLIQGQSILIFPEGTMNRGAQPLATYYDGAFRLAIETQTPIAPMVIKNARHLFSRNNPLAVRPGLITCVFSAPVSVKGLTQSDLPDLKERVFRIMETAITKSV